MRTIVITAFILCMQLGFANENIVASSYLWKAYSDGTDSQGSIYITQDEKSDTFAAFIKTKDSFEVLNLNIISKYVTNIPLKGPYARYELELVDSNTNFDIDEFTLQKRYGKWSIDRLRVFNKVKKQALFIVHHGSYYGEPPADDCPRFCKSK